MALKSILFFICLVVSLYSFSQEAIDVTEQTIKVKGMKEEEIQLGFAAGDKIIFNFKEVNDKDMKEVEILEYPSTSKFSDFKISMIENKTLSVSKQSVYIFRFKNSAISGRVCKIRIQRIPANENTRNFNTSVSWVTRQDTSWNTFTKDVVIGYDTVYLQKSKKEIVSREQKEEIILDKIERVHSETNANGNRSSVFFSLPPNAVSGNTSIKVIAWVYWIGVGEEANVAWKKNVSGLSALAKGAGIISPLGALAIGVISHLATPGLGEDVKYSLVDRQNRDLFLANREYRGWDYGKGVAGYKKFTEPDLCQGTYFICMHNDNVMQGINATVKVSAIIETTTYTDKTYTEQVINPRYEKQLMKEPVIKTATVPVAGL